MIIINQSCRLFIWDFRDWILDVLFLYKLHKISLLFLFKDKQMVEEEFSSQLRSAEAGYLQGNKNVQLNLV